MVITTRDATLFSNSFPRLSLDTFDEKEACLYMHARFSDMKRSEQEFVNTLVGEVGLVPHQLELAACYL